MGVQSRFKVRLGYCYFGNYNRSNDFPPASPHLNQNYLGVSIKRRLTLLRVRNRHLSPRRFRGVIRANVTFRSKSSFAVSATLTSTKSVTSGAGCPLSIHAFQDMRSSVVSPRSVPQSPSSSLATLLPVGCLVDSDGNCPDCQAGSISFWASQYTYSSLFGHRRQRILF